MSFNNLNLDKDEGLGDAQKSLAARNCGIAQNHSVIILCKLRKERYLPTISTQLHNTALFLYTPFHPNVCLYSFYIFC